MAAIKTATLTVKSKYKPTDANDMSSSLNKQSWGRIALWNPWPWMPWDSRGIIGVLGWQDFHGRIPFMGSEFAPGYDTGSQAPKGWDTLTKTRDIIFTNETGQHTDPCASVGSGPYTYSGGVANPDIAFDLTSRETLLSTLKVTAYAYNSYPPLFGGPDPPDWDKKWPDEMDFYYTKLTIETVDGIVTHHRAATWKWVDDYGDDFPPTEPPDSGDIVNPGNGVDHDETSFAIIYAEAGPMPSSSGTSKLWYPTIYFVDSWEPGDIPPDSGEGGGGGGTGGGGDSGSGAGAKGNIMFYHI